jgi:hypothetical protein
VNRFPFEVDERCFDCVELYHGCHAHPENPDSRCADYFPLPDVGVNGDTGQEIPPSKMGGRKEPRVRLPNRQGGQAPRQTAQPPAHRARQTRPEPIEQAPVENGRRQSPAAIPGSDGQRFCTCGAILRKRERCCGACRLQRRQETMQRRRSGKQPCTAVGSVLDVPFIHARMSATQRRSRAHN